ncbi:flagellar hook-associated protein FlgL [Brevibacillus sp. SYP-B805]|uniref:flagellar hook-associated protein FlgL n=1 Tax=Brevibacillus sp. SYP-B805 TaxID=1578199 RepID=UPI0013ED4E22|nr:flagellar hook-associated protein FlgL [Brevibacillus sp. SYP-B805]
MSIRVTQTMLNNNMLRNLSRSMGNMDKLQEQLASGRRFSKPSDDPVAATRSLFYRSSLVENEQYQQNASEAQSWLEITDNSLEEANSILQRVRELVVQSGDGSLSKDSLTAMAKEIRQIKDHLGNIANQTIGSRYIFAGAETNKPPYNQATGVFDNTNSQEITLELSERVLVPININPQEVFNYRGQSGTGDNIFQLLDKIATDLEAGNDATSYLGSLDQQLDNLLAQRATLGARMNRIELVQGRLQDQELNVTKLMSANEDADVAEVITNLKTQENVQRAALGAGARIIQPSLLDFLR